MEFSLWSTASERAEFEDLADMYAILRTLEMIEIANARDALEHGEYVEVCQKLINQYKTTERPAVQRGAIRDLASFVRDYGIDCPRAVERITVGTPDNPFQGSRQDDKKSAIVLVREMTELFILCANLISLERLAVDELMPNLEALLRAIARAKSIIPGYEPVALDKWLRTMQQMRASDELSQEDGRQLLHDLNTSKAEIDEITSRG